MADAALVTSSLPDTCHYRLSNYYEWDCFSYLPTNMILNVSGDEGHSDLYKKVMYTQLGYFHGRVHGVMIVIDVQVYKG